MGYLSPFQCIPGQPVEADSNTSLGCPHLPCALPDPSPNQSDHCPWYVSGTMNPGRSSAHAGQTSAQGCEDTGLVLGGGRCIPTAGPEVLYSDVHFSEAVSLPGPPGEVSPRPAAHHNSGEGGPLSLSPRPPPNI